jgi:hypothetical protein
VFHRTSLVVFVLPRNLVGLWQPGEPLRARLAAPRTFTQIELGQSPKRARETERSTKKLAESRQKRLSLLRLL